MQPTISLPRIPKSADPELRDFLTAILKVLSDKQLNDYSAIESLKTEIKKLKG